MATDEVEPEGGVLRIGLVTDCYVPRLGGIEMQVHDLARHLQAAGHEVVVITPTPGPEVMDGIRVHRMDVPLAPFDIPFAPSTFELVADLLEAERVDVAHFHGGIVSPVAFVGGYDAQKRDIPTVLTTHCLWSYATPMFRLLDRTLHWSRWNAVFSAVSEVAAEPITRIAPGREVVVLPNGIENDTWQVDPVERDDDEVVIVSVMRLAPRKRPLHLLKMFHDVLDRVPRSASARLVIIGEGPEQGGMEKYLAATHLGDRVELTGRLSRAEIRERFARADVFVAPANLESFGIAALEARCAGLPVVAKAQTGVREFVRHEQEGLLASSDKDMVDQLVRLITDPALRRRIAEHNRTTPSDVDWSEVVARNVETYRKAIAQTGRTP